MSTTYETILVETHDRVGLVRLNRPKVRNALNSTLLHELNDALELFDADPQASAKGYGFHEAPRGSLGHWVKIKDQKIENFQIVVPGTWNGSPRDAKNQRGPYEEALIGTPVANPEQPVEILRTIHSFDPCMA